MLVKSWRASWTLDRARSVMAELLYVGVLFLNRINKIIQCCIVCVLFHGSSQTRAKSIVTKVWRLSDAWLEMRGHFILSGGREREGKTKHCNIHNVLAQNSLVAASEWQHWIWIGPWAEFVLLLDIYIYLFGRTLFVCCAANLILPHDYRHKWNKFWNLPLKRPQDDGEVHLGSAKRWAFCEIQ